MGYGHEGSKAETDSKNTNQHKALLVHAAYCLCQIRSESSGLIRAGFALTVHAVPLDLPQRVIAWMAPLP